MPNCTHDQDLAQNFGDMKAAIPVVNGMLCRNFTQGEQFAIITVINGAITQQKLLVPPSKEPDVLPAWLSDLGCTDIFVAGMNLKAQAAFLRHGVQVTCGVPADTPENIVHKCVRGQLIVSGCTSDDGEEGHGCCPH